MTALAGDQADIDVGVVLVESVQPRHQPIGGEGEVGRHLQHLMLMLLGDCTEACVHRLQPGLYVIEENLPGVRQFDAAIDAIKQPRRQLLFQSLDLLTDGRLSGAELDGSSSKTAQPCGGFKSAKQIQ